MSVKPLPVHIVDLSHYQPVTQTYINDLKRSGVQGVYYKVSEGNRMSWVTKYNEVRKYCRASGVKFGAYHFAGPQNSTADAADEAKHFMRLAKPLPGDLIPMLDLESRAAGMSKTATTAWARAFVTEVKRHGFDSIIYTPFDLTSTLGCKLWVARYSNTNAAPRIPSPWKNYSVRQFSNGVYGVPNQIARKRIDLNTLLGNDGTTVESLLIPSKKSPPKPKVLWEGRVTTANIQQYPRLIPDVEQSFTKVLSGSDIVGWQEIGNATYKKKLKAIGRFRHIFQGPIKAGHFVETPISVRDGIEVRKTGEIQWQEPNPTTKRLVNRFASRVVLELGGKPVDVYSVHFIARAWNADGTAKPRPKKSEAAEQPLRQKGWQNAHDALMADLKESGNGPAIILTDQNRMRVPILPDTFKGRKVHAVRNGIDWIYFIDGKGSKWELVGNKTNIPNASDHAAVMQRVRLVKK